MQVRMLAAGALITMVFSATYLLSGCSKAGDDDQPVVSSVSEYQEVLKEAERLSLKHLQDLDSGEPLTDPDKRDLKKAASLFDALAEYQPANIALFLGAGKIYQALGNDDAAILRFQRGLATVPPKPAPAILDTAIEAHYLFSVSLFNKHDYDAAMDQINAAIGAYATSPIYYSQRAAIRIELRQYKAAYQDLVAAFKLDPNHQRGRTLMKLLLISSTDEVRLSAEKKLNAKDYAGVIADTTKGLDVAPDYVVLLNLRAAAYLSLGQKDKARIDVAHALKVEPDNPDSRTLKARLK